MSGAPPRSRRPQYGWQRVTLLQDEILGEPGGLLPSRTDAVLRTSGMLRGAVIGRVEIGDSSGTGQFGFLVEGSQTGGTANDEWIELGSTNKEELLDAGAITLQARVLGLSKGASTGEGFIGEGQVSFGRWKYIRVRTIVDNEDALDPVSFEIHIRVVGVAGDGQHNMDELSLVRTSGDVVEPESVAVKRPEGVRYISAQVTLDDIIQVGGTDGFLFVLEVAANQSAVDNDQFAVLDVLGPFTTVGQEGFFVNGQVTLIDLGSWQFYRVVGRIYDNGSPPGVNSSYAATVRISHDDNDWIDGEIGISQLNSSLQSTFIQVVGGPVTGTPPNMEVTVQICDMNQQPIRAARGVGLLLSNSQLGGIDDLCATAVFSGATVGTLQYGTGNNVAVVLTNASGVATLQVDANADDPVFLYAWNGHIPEVPANNTFGPGQVVIASERIVII